jgi:hypothetical protein
MTNAWMWNHTPDVVYKKVDSLLYENIPGKIISRTTITRNGYKGFDIINRTRRGDIQRYNIFITPFEVIFFKMSGTGDYVSRGDEAKKFFGSIQFKEYKNELAVPGNGWKKFSPAYGGFAAELPHEPYIGNDGSWIYDAEDKATSTYYRIIRTDIHNYKFAEEDSFDLGLMDESFKASEFIDTQLLRRQTNFKGYSALDGRYKDKDGHIFLTRFIIQGPHYYTLVSHGKKELPQMQAFLNSFEIKPFVYGEPKTHKDTSLYYTVTTPYFPEEKKIRIDMNQYNYYGRLSDEDDEEESDLLESGTYRNRIISNDTTGEKIFISFFRSPRYYYVKDSTVLDKENQFSFAGDTAWIIKWKNKYELPNKTRVWEAVITDSGSSRTIQTKSFYKAGIGFSLMTQSDTLSKPSAFISHFFKSFSPTDTLRGINPFIKKSSIFFDDFMSSDTLLHKRAVKHIDEIEIDSTDLPMLKKAIGWMNWKEKKYLDVKKSLIDKLGDIKTDASALYLKEQYYALDDTVQLQYSVLENLLQHKTKFAYSIFREIINAEPPVLDFTVSDYSAYDALRLINFFRSGYRYANGMFLDDLSDSLKLTRTILPDLLPLLNLEDYKSSIMKLLGEMIDSNLVKPKDYEGYFSKFLIEARQEIKKQAIAEKKKAIEKAEEAKSEKKSSSLYGIDDDKDSGNEDLSLYATLLLPFWESNIAVQPLIQQMLRSADKRLKYNTLFLLIDKGKPYPDSLLTYFGSLEKFRYELYNDLKKRKLLEKFPAAYNTHLDLARSALMDKKEYSKPDTIAYLDRLKAAYKGKNGFIYFFKYKEKKDDLTWKLATAGLVPEDPGQFEFEDSTSINISFLSSPLLSSYRFNKYDFTDFTDTKLKADISLDKQLSKELKKLLYSRRKSAKEFYGDENGRTTDY